MQRRQRHPRAFPVVGRPVGPESVMENRRSYYSLLTLKDIIVHLTSGDSSDRSTFGGTLREIVGDTYWYCVSGYHRLCGPLCVLVPSVARCSVRFHVPGMVRLWDAL